jgi:hypothetical protein
VIPVSLFTFSYIYQKTPILAYIHAELPSLLLEFIVSMSYLKQERREGVRTSRRGGGCVVCSDDRSRSIGQRLN